MSAEGNKTTLPTKTWTKQVCCTMDYFLKFSNREAEREETENSLFSKIHNFSQQILWQIRVEGFGEKRNLNQEGKVQGTTKELKACLAEVNDCN